MEAVALLSKTPVRTIEGQVEVARTQVGGATGRRARACAGKGPEILGEDGSRRR